MKNKKSYQNYLYQIIGAISSLGLEEMLIKIDKIVTNMTDADSTGIYTLDEKTDSVVLRASKLHFKIVNKLKMKRGEGITGWVVEHGEVVVVENEATKDPRFSRVVDLPDDLYESFLSVPIKSNLVVVGVINVKHKDSHRYPKEQIEALENIGELVGRAVEHAILLEKSKSLEEAIETQKLVNRAKGILMDKKNLSENDAYHQMRVLSMKKRKSMRSIAEAMVTANDLTKR